MSVLVLSKKKYRTYWIGSFKSKARTNSGKKKLARDPYLADGSIIHQPKKAKWPRHPGGHWWGSFPKRRHAA